MRPLPIAGAAERAGYRTFAAALRASEHIAVLEGAGPFTVFAPNDEAFKRFSKAALDRLLEGDPEMLRLVIGYHFASGKVLARTLRGKRIRASMHAGGDVILNGRDGLRANAARIVEPDIEASNGVIHGMDAVLWPRESVMAADVG